MQLPEPHHTPHLELLRPNVQVREVLPELPATSSDAMTLACDMSDCHGLMLYHCLDVGALGVIAAIQNPSYVLCFEEDAPQSRIDNTADAGTFYTSARRLQQQTEGTDESPDRFETATPPHRDS